MKIFYNDTLGIMMEKVDTNDIQSLFYELELVSIEKELPILDIDYRKEDVSRYARRMYLDIKKGISEIRVEGNQGLDINAGNIGRRPNGDFVIFDQTENLIFDDYLGLIEIENKLENIPEEELLNINLKKIIFCKNKIKESLLKQNNFNFETNNQIEIFINKFGEYEMKKGYDYLVNSIMLGNMKFKAKIVGGKNIETEKPCKLNKDLVFKEILNIDFFEEIKRIIEF